MFWKNLKAIFQNSPLALSESYDPHDVSINRLAFFFYLGFVLFSPLLVMWLLPHVSEKFLPYWQGVAALLGGQTFANMGKKVINAYKEMKGSGAGGQTDSSRSGAFGASGAGGSQPPDGTERM